MKVLTDQFEAMEVAPATGLWRTLRADFRAKSAWYYATDTRSAVLRAVMTDGSLCMILHRLANGLRRWHLGWIGAFVYKLNSLLTGAVIGRGAQFGPGLVILHSVGTVVNSAVRGGANVVLEGGVTIGAEKGESPELGSNVFVGSGARIIGGVMIGDGARIGANAVVTKDVPPGATAVGVPAEVVKVRGEAD